MWLFIFFRKTYFLFNVFNTFSKLLSAGIADGIYARLVTSAKQHRYPCPWEPNGLNELPEMRFGISFHPDWQINNGLFTRPIMTCTQTELTRSLIPFVAQVANCCLRPSFWFSCTLVPCDCFCGASYWSNPPSPPPPEMLVSLRSDDGEILRRQTWSRGLGVRSPSQWREK